MTFTADKPERLDRYLSRMMPQHSRTRLTKLIEASQVFVNGKPSKPSYHLTPGDSVQVASEPETARPHNLDPVQMDLEILYEDDDLLVVNKPRGLATHPAATLREPSLVNALLARGQLSSGSESFRPGIVHRLDKETTGVLVVAKTDAAHWKLARQIAEKSAERRYVAVVQGELDQEVFNVDAPIARDPRNRFRMTVDAKGKSAITHVRRMGRVDAGAVIVASLETGRTHQIRVHLRAVGHPVVGDSLYNPQKSVLPLQLHAAYLSFDHPVSGQRISVYAAPPDDFVAGDLISRELVER